MPLLVDGFSLAALVVALRAGPGTAVATLQTPAGYNVLYLLGAYLFMCAGVYLLRKLEPGPDASAWAQTSRLLARPTRMVLGVLFGLATTTVMAYQFGYFNAIFVVDTLALGEGESAMLFAFAPGAWLGLSLVYTAVLALHVTPTVRWGKRPLPLAGVPRLTVRQRHVPVPGGADDGRPHARQPLRLAGPLCSQFSSVPLAVRPAAPHLPRQTTGHGRRFVPHFGGGRRLAGRRVSE
jgi:hypothetical protein